MPPRRGGAARGFTLVELAVVIVLLGILAFTAMTRMESGLLFRQVAFHDQVVAALRHAQRLAVAHRRLVCADVSGNQVALSVAANFGDTGCGAGALPGPDGRLPAAATPNASITLQAVPAGPLFFQPAGTVSSDAAGTATTDFQLTVTGQPVIVVWGVTGHVE
jgi:prepilin-type N-terminal cleavage/methylation domain-containing protein